MTLPFLPSALRAIFVHRRQLILYMATWTALLTATVAVTSFSPQIAFVWAVSPSSLSLERTCGGGSVGVPLDGPAGEVVCVPAQFFGQSKVDFLVPPVFAALVVAGSACFVRAIGLWETPDDDF